MADSIAPKPTAGRDSSDVAISVRDLRVQYGTREILHGVNFEVPAGETLVIMGGSGCARSSDSSAPVPARS